MKRLSMLMMSGCLLAGPFLAAQIPERPQLTMAQIYAMTKTITGPYTEDGFGNVSSLWMTNLINQLAPMGYFLTEENENQGQSLPGYQGVVNIYTFPFANVKDSTETLQVQTATGLIKDFTPPNPNAPLPQTKKLDTIQLVVTSQDPDQYNSWLATIRSNKTFYLDPGNSGLFMQTYRAPYPGGTTESFSISENTAATTATDTQIVRPLTFTLSYQRIVEYLAPPQ